MASGLKKFFLTLFPFSGVLGSSLMIAWATEVAAFFLSRGLAFAVLALLQVLPEFAVEAVITQNAAQGTGELLREGVAFSGADELVRLAGGLDLVTANFTGANRLLVGLFLPLVFFVYAGVKKREGEPVTAIPLPMTTSLEVVALIIPTLYSFTFALRGSITLWDAGVLTGMYILYLAMAYRLPSEEEDEASLPYVPRMIMQQPARLRTTLTTGLFVGGGALLFLSVEPFYHNTIGLAITLGIPAYFLFQWIAPLLSEFPELITVTYWAKRGRAALGITNVVSSKINQWTLLIAMIPIVYGVALLRMGFDLYALPLGASQQVEILITAAQGLFAAACLLSLRFERWQAWTLCLLWFVQAADPLIDPFLAGWLPSPMPAGLRSGELVREWFTIVYLVLTAVVVYRDRHELRVLTGIRRIWTQYLRPGASADQA